MARTDDHPIQILFPDYKPAHASDMVEYLNKLAEGELEMGGTVPDKTELYPDPGEGKDLHREEEPHRNALGHEDAFHSSDTVFRESSNVRRGILDREFAQFKTQAGNEKAMMAANFAHVRSGDFEAHSAFLQPKTASLEERVKKIIK